ncbi:MAG: glycosyltransferase family 39 protein [Nostoc sp.]|uniref:glycosyltransferase family 39 protein n=1 Tax=Nostoc sp. TaxID=1180 RepID=UPI002FEF6D95
MKKQLSQNWIISKSWLRFLMIIILVIGVFFRFVNLDRKIYWNDEVYSSLRISGYLESEMNDRLRNGRLVSLEDLQKYQYPNSEKNTIDTIKGLISEESQVVPLYFVILRFWVEWFGNSVAVIRSLSAFISLLTFPCLYWLCKELFGSSLIGWMSIALIAVSPIHVLYAQEARTYSLWIVAILISSIALLRAMRLKTKVSWCIYAATLSLGFYSHLFFTWIALGQGVYVAVIERLRLSKTSINYLFSALAGVITFLPWIWIIITHPTPDKLSWANAKQTLFESAIRWVGIISRAFLDVGIGSSEPLKFNIALIFCIFIILALIIYSIYVLCRRTSKEVWLFILILIGSVALPLLAVDLLFEKQSTSTRYLLPVVLGMQLAVAYLFTIKLTSISPKIWQKKLWSLVVSIVLISGIVSCMLSFQAQLWWIKVPQRYQEYPEIANILSKTNKPLLISDADMIFIQTLGHLLDPKVRFQFVPQEQLPEITNGFTDIFLFKPSDFLKAGIEKIYNSKLQQIDRSLWKITKST